MVRWHHLAWLLLPLSCSRSTAPTAGTPAVEPSPVSAPAQPAMEPKADSAPIVFLGMCDASGAVSLSADRFAVADDEDNVLRVYDANRGGAPLWQRDVSPDLDLPVKVGKKRKKPKKPPETDIEAATRLDELALWLTSHGRNSSGKLKPERLRFFATTAPTEGSELQVVGETRSDLLDVLVRDARFAPFELEEAALLAPKDPGGLNIEGMTARSEGGVWIGLRNPIPHGKALLFPLLNPLAMVKDDARAEVGAPVLLDLGGLGVRSLSYWRGRYLIMGGAFAAGVASRLFAWDGRSAGVAPLREVDSDLNPEGFFTPDEREQVLLLSDDGTRLVDGKECKKHKDPAQKSFRGVWMTP